MAERPSRGEVEDALEVAQHATVTSRYPLVGILAAEVRALRGENEEIKRRWAADMDALTLTKARVHELASAVVRVHALPAAWRASTQQLADVGPVDGQAYAMGAIEVVARDLEKALKGE